MNNSGYRKTENYSEKPINARDNRILTGRDMNSAIYELYDEEVDDYDDYDQKETQRSVHKHQHRANGFERFIYFLVRAFIGAACITTVLFIFVLKVMTVSGDSMSPSIRSGDYIAVNKLDTAPTQGDIVVILSSSADKAPTVKRVAATENQVVSIDYDKNTVYVDGVAFYPELYGKADIEPLGDVEYPVTVPKGCYFVLGDNLSNSLDSRSSSVGMVSKEDILGTVMLDYRKGKGLTLTDDTPIDTPVEEQVQQLSKGIEDLIDNISKTISNN